MTAKQDPFKVDAMNCIHHAAELGMPIDRYTAKVTDYARKRIRMISKGLSDE